MNLDIYLIALRGNTWAFNYDQYGRLTNIANPLGQAKTYVYDKMSRVTEYKDPVGRVTGYAYDPLNRLARKDIAVPSGAHSITDYTYDAVGNLLNIANGDSAVAYTYDALNRLTAIVNPANITVAFAYDAVGRRTSKKIFRTTPELLAEAEYEYDAAGQLLAITNKAGGKVVAFNKYQYDANGNRTRIEDQDGIWDYKYDAANRLTVALPWPVDYVKAEVFVYDKNGNRRYDKTAWDYHYDAANRLVENSTYTYTHDANGNLTSKSNRFDNSQTTYAYTPEQQLSDVTTPEHKVQYKYDPLGRRTARTVDGRAIKFVYDGQDIIAELDDTNAAINTYTNGPGIDEPLIMTKADGKAYFYHADALGSIKAITDDSGKTIETYKYKSYGQPTIRNAQGQTIPTSLIGNLRMFAAREYEPETGLYNNRHRHLDPVEGAFTQEDPVYFNGGGIDFYIYARNNPTNYIDPNGEWIVGAVGSGFGAVTGGLGNLAGQLLTNGSNWDTVKWKDVGVSAVTGGVAGLLMTTPLGGSYGGAALIGSATNIVNYLATNNPSEYSVKGSIGSIFTGALGGLLGGRVKNPYSFGEMSPGLNSLKTVDGIFTGTAFLSNILGSTASSYLDVRCK